MQRKLRIHRGEKDLEETEALNASKNFFIQSDVAEKLVEGRDQRLIEDWAKAFFHRQGRALQTTPIHDELIIEVTDEEGS